MTALGTGRAAGRMARVRVRWLVRAGRVAERWRWADAAAPLQPASPLVRAELVTVCWR